MSDARMRVTSNQCSGRDVPDELAALVLRAGRLGFCRRRVATALGISASSLAAIEQAAGLTSGNAAEAPPVDRPPR
jgi:hypothetical protein